MKHTGNGAAALIALSLLCGSGCTKETSAPQPRSAAPVAAATVTAEDEHWVQSELLMQLKEIKADLAEIKTLKAEVQALRAEVAKLAASPPAVAPAVARGSAPRLQAGGIELGDSPALGSSSAKVGIVEFSDYECPYCARHHQRVFPLIKQEFVTTGQARYFARQYPLAFHSRAKGASIAALCAGREGKYWDMHDALFAGGRSLGDELYRTTAKGLSLDTEAFARCAQDSAIQKHIAADIAYGNSIGVSGTPKFFIGRISGRELVDVTVLDGAQPFASFKAAIEAKLKS